MNERIKELAAQAGFMVDQSGTIMVCFTSTGDSEVKKFAELIVADCIDTIRESTKSHLKVGATESELFEIHLRVEGALVAMAAVSKHFGVEE